MFRFKCEICEKGFKKISHYKVHKVKKKPCRPNIQVAPDFPQNAPIILHKIQTYM